MSSLLQHSAPLSPLRSVTSRARFLRGAARPRVLRGVPTAIDQKADQCDYDELI